MERRETSRGRTELLYSLDSRKCLRQKGNIRHGSPPPIGLFIHTGTETSARRDHLRTETTVHWTVETQSKTTHFTPVIVSRVRTTRPVPPFMVLFDLSVFHEDRDGRRSDKSLVVGVVREF